MHFQDPGICEFPSRRFYNGELETDPTVLAREKERKFRFCHPPESGNTSMFCHVVGAEKVNFSLDRGGEFSFYNEIEAQVVVIFQQPNFFSKCEKQFCILVVYHEFQLTCASYISCQDLTLVQGF